MWSFCKAPWQLPPRTQATALCCSFDQALRPKPSVVKGVQACRLPSFKPLHPCVATSTRHSGHSPLLLKCARLQTPTIVRGNFDLQALRPQPSVVQGVQACHLMEIPCSNLPFARPSPLLLRAFKPAVCQASSA